MKKLILLSGFFVATTTFAAELHNYNDIVSAISKGTPLHIVTDFNQCTTANKTDMNMAASMSVGSFTPNEIGVSGAHIATALTHFTFNDPFFPDKGVNEFVRYTITPDNNMNVILRVLDPTSYTVLKGPFAFDCKIDAATKIYT